MTDPLEHLIRSTLTDLAEEAPIVHDHLSRAERRVRNRRRATVTMGAVGTLAAVLIAAPFALAGTGSDQPRPAVPSPSGPAVVPTPSGPVVVPTPSGPPGVPSPSGPVVVPTPSGPPGVPSPAHPTVEPSPPGPPGVPSPAHPTVVPSPPGPPGVPSRAS